MERKEPTLSPSSGMSEPEAVPRRSQSYSAPPDDVTPARPARQSTSAPVTHTAPPSSLPAAALVLALIAIIGAGFLGWKLFQAESILKQADLRIQGLEQQLNLTSEESSASVVTLQANFKKLDADVRKLIADAEANRKAIAAQGEKAGLIARDVNVAKKEGAEAKAGLATIKQEIAANKSSADAASAKIDSVTAAITQQNKSVQDVKEALAKLQLELSDIDSLAARTRTNEEAIAAIDDFRRSVNRDILQIKQQLNSAPQ